MILRHYFKIGAIFACLLIPVLTWAENEEQASKAPGEASQKESAQATRPDSQTGFSSSLGFGGLWINSNNQLLVDSGNEEANIEDNDRYNKFMAVIMLDLKYTTASGTQFYAGTPVQENDFAFKLGVGRELDRIGQLDFYLSPSLFAKVWEDPYITVGERKAVNTSDWKVGVEWDRVAGTGLKLSYTLEFVDVSHDVIGERFDQLGRDGSIYTAEAEYAFEIGDGVLLYPSFAYSHAEMDGQANSYQGYATGLGLKKVSRKYLYLVELTYGQNKFDSVHPIFDEIHEENRLGVFAMLTWFNPAELNRWYFTAGLGWFRNEANIDFFDSTTTFTLLTVGYRF